MQIIRLKLREIAGLIKCQQHGNKTFLYLWTAFGASEQLSDI